MSKILRRKKKIRRYVAIFLVFISISITGYAQSSLRSILHINTHADYKNKKPKKIIEKFMTYLADKTISENSVKKFDDAGMLTKEERFDDSNTLTARLTYINDTAKHLILSRTLERFTPYGNSVETAFYTYDVNGHLIHIEDKSDVTVISRTDITNNENGDPVMLIGYDGNGSPYGTEKAKYAYEKNSVIIQVVNNDGRLLSSDTSKINYQVADTTKNEKYNAQGDIINYQEKNRASIKTYQCKYEYDSFGNCTDEKIFLVTIKSNRKQKQQLEREYLKQYFY